MSGIADERLGEIEARAAAATPGPWRNCGAGMGGCICGLVWTIPLDTVAAQARRDGALDCKGHWPGRDDLPETDFKADAAFVAHAREDVPALVAEVRTLQAERDRLAAENERLNGWEDKASELGEKCERLAAEVARLESMRGAYEEAADAREAREDALADAEEERSELRAKCERLEAITACCHDHLYFSAGKGCPCCLYEKAAEERAKAEVDSMMRERHNFLALLYQMRDRRDLLPAKALPYLDHALSHMDGRLDWTDMVCCPRAERLEAEAGAMREALTECNALLKRASYDSAGFSREFQCKCDKATKQFDALLAAWERAAGEGEGT